MRKLRIGVLSGGVLMACGFSALGQGSNEVRSRLPCLAPLIWRWESGEFPLSLGEAFFRGPYRFREFPEVPDEEAVPFPVEDLKEKPEAQRLFDKGVALVHGFRDQEAERAFRQMQVQAPGCAMAYWGLALANGTTPDRARLFASEAKLRLGASANEKERMWIEWMADFFDNKKLPDERERRRRAVRDLETIVREFPEDLHGRAFLVRQVVLNETRGGLGTGSRLAIDRMMDEISSEVSSYPLSAYRIFLWLEDRPEWVKGHSPGFGEAALTTGESRRFQAQLCLARGDPEGALKLFESAMLNEMPWLEEKEGVVDSGMPEESGILAESAGQWVATLGGMGRVTDAERAADGVASLPRNPYYRRNLGRDETVLDARTQTQRELLRTWIEWGLWERILEQTDESPAGGTIDNYTDCVWISDRVAARSMADFHLGKEDGFRTGMKMLEGIAERLPPRMRNRGAAAGFASGMAVQLKSYGEFCEGGPPNSAGYEFAGKTRMAWVCLETGRIEEALRLSAEDLAERPGFFGARANASAIRFKAGKVKEAIFLMDREFRQQAGRADSDLPVIKELDEVAAVLKLPEDWTLEPEEELVEPKQEDRTFPMSEKLEWKLSEAPAWTLPNWKGEEVSLDQFSGKPVLLVFFLGGGCLHCVQQLTALVPRVPEYRAAGIPIVAISTDGAEILSRTLGKEVDPEKAFPFEIVSDRELKVFKAYGVFDQFEKRALHGTFLLDREGEIVWRELSHEPFLKPDFLLKEAKRLLKP